MNDHIIIKDNRKNKKGKIPKYKSKNKSQGIKKIETLPEYKQILQSMAKLVLLGY